MTTRQRIAAALLAVLLIAGVGLRLYPRISPAAVTEACVVDDLQHVTVQQAGVFASPLVREAAKAKGIAWHVVTPADEGPDMAEVQWAIEASRGHTLPTLCLRSGGRTSVQPLPATAQAVIEALNR